MTKKPARKVKPVKAWAVLVDGEIFVNLIDNTRKQATNLKKAWGKATPHRYSGPIRVIITPAPRKK